MGTGIKESIYHSPVSRQAPYSYRSGIPLIPSAEYSVYFNDFFEQTTSNAVPGTTAIIDTGATIVATETDAISEMGAVRITDATASEGAAMYWPKGIQVGNGDKFVMEVRVQTSDVTDNNLQFGLSDLTATTNPEDLYTTAAANLIAFGILDGDATVTMLCDKDNSGAAANLGNVDLVVDTWTILAIEVEGSAASSNMSVKGYVNGQLAITWDVETEIPDDLALAPFIAMVNGNGAGANTSDWDYVRWAVKRS
jgi:hypothetical protein